MKWLAGLLALVTLSAWADLPYRPRAHSAGPTAYASGEPLDAKREVSSYRLYCSDVRVLDNITPDSKGGFSYQFARGELSPGLYSCYAVALDLQLREGVRSNTVDFAVGADSPGPFTLQVK